MRLFRCCLLIALALFFGGGPARAATPNAEKQARRSFERAETHFKAGLFAEALGEYQDGYERLPLPGFLINIAQCHRRLGDLVQARTTYRKFLLVAPDSPYGPEVKALVAELDTLLDSPGSAGATPSAGKEESPSDTSESARLSPKLEPSPTAGPASTNILVTAPTNSPAPPSATGTRWWLWGSIGGAVVAGAAAAVFLSRAPDSTTVHEGSLGTLRR